MPDLSRRPNNESAIAHFARRFVDRHPNRSHSVTIAFTFVAKSTSLCAVALPRQRDRACTLCVVVRPEERNGSAAWRAAAVVLRYCTLGHDARPHRPRSQPTRDQRSVRRYHRGPRRQGAITDHARRGSRVDRFWAGAHPAAVTRSDFGGMCPLSTEVYRDA
jgi:hypothetical protein